MEIRLCEEGKKLYFNDEKFKNDIFEAANKFIQKKYEEDIEEFKKIMKEEFGKQSNGEPVQYQKYLHNLHKGDTYDYPKKKVIGKRR